MSRAVREALYITDLRSKKGSTGERSSITFRQIIWLIATLGVFCLLVLRLAGVIALL
jgi:hypothetical protein